MKARTWRCLAAATFGGLLALSAAPSVSIAADLSASNSAIVSSYDAYPGDDYSQWHQSGTCVWNIVDGVLTVRPMDGNKSGVLGDSSTLWCAPIYGDRQQIRSVEFMPGVKATTCSQMFMACSNLESIHFSDLDTSAVTDMSEMFDECNKLESLDLSTLDTSSVTNMSQMFADCYALKSVDLSSLDTSHVVNMNLMFMCCTSLQPSDVYVLDTSSVNNFMGMFTGCSFTSFDLSKLDFSNATEMFNLFNDCENLRSVNLSGVKFKTQNPASADYGGMFLGCTGLSKITTDSNTEGISFPCFWNYIYNVTPEPWRHNGQWVDSSGHGSSYPNAPIPSKQETYVSKFYIDASMFNVDLSSESYTGSSIVKSVSSSYFNKEDFSVSYSNNVNPGVATLTVSGISTGRIIGSVDFHFSIDGGGEWIHSAGGWWWRNPDGSYPSSKWMSINGSWFWFNASGYMATGWQKISGTWYYFNNTGAMVTGWQGIGGSWYLFGESGSMLTGWQQVKGSWYYLNSSGSMATGWLHIGSSWYYLKTSGEMATGWLYLNGTWYYFDGSGVMQSGWQFIDGNWYFFNSGGCMLTDWFSAGGAWYYSSNSGEMQSSQWIGNYYLTASGAMATNTWIDDYYVGPDGAWIPGYGQGTSGGSSRWDGVTAYWTPSGKKWHKSRNCPTLSNSNNVIAGTVDGVGSRQLCKVCG